MSGHDGQVRKPGARGPLQGEIVLSSSVIAHVLIVVQNLPVPLDRRVWLEAQALTAAGYAVTVICPKGPGDPGRQTLDGVEIYKYRPAPQADGVVGYVWEFAYSWVADGDPLGQGVATPAVPSHAGVQPPGHLLAPCPPLEAPRRVLRVRPARPEPRVVPLSLRHASKSLRRSSSTRG